MNYNNIERGKTRSKVGSKGGIYFIQNSNYISLLDNSRALSFGKTLKNSRLKAHLEYNLKVDTVTGFRMGVNSLVFMFKLGYNRPKYCV